MEHAVSKYKLSGGECLPLQKPPHSPQMKTTLNKYIELLMLSTGNGVGHRWVGLWEGVVGVGLGKSGKESWEGEKCPKKREIEIQASLISFKIFLFRILVLLLG